MNNRRTPDSADAARHICEEARVVLTYVRAGPPTIAHGDLAHNLIFLRRLTKATFLENDFVVEDDETKASVREEGGKLEKDSSCTSLPLELSSSGPYSPKRKSYPPFGQAHREPHSPMTTRASSSKIKSQPAVDLGASETEIILPFDSVSLNHIAQEEESTVLEENADKQPTEPLTDATAQPKADEHDDVGQFAFPFVAVIMDPRAAGPQTLVAVRALHRLLEQRSLLPKRRLRTRSRAEDHRYTASLDALTRGVLQCKFEQTDAGADEAVEMAIADFYSFIVRMDASVDHDSDKNDILRIQPTTKLEAFKTLFVNRNTWVHSPALCYHFDTVLGDMITATFQFSASVKTYDIAFDEETFARQESAARPILDFLVQQLLHTPMALQASSTINRGVGAVTRSYAVTEAQVAHDATRVLCLRLLRSALQTGWRDEKVVQAMLSHARHVTNKPLSPNDYPNSCFDIIQDDLCLSLLLMGQQLVGNGASVKVLSEVCSTISCIWNLRALRSALPLQLEAIFNGFFQRTLIMLRNRPAPTDSIVFNSNLLFDTECELVLETLLDILCLHENGPSCISTLEELFITFDCDVSRSDVAFGLILELCRCSGAPIVTNDAINNIRQVPAHLRELCSEALVGCLRTLFQNMHDAHNSPRQSGPVYHPSVLSERKKLKLKLRQGTALFNQKPTAGLQFLASEGVLPSPLRPKDVALFLRQGLALGIDKSAVGMYLGEVGKAPMAGKSPHDCERDWFHHETLVEYCNFFHFESQSVLSCLRMFLSSFRLPGEAQQIDRILQAFAENCGRKCIETVDLKFFSDDPKKAADAAYLLAFSIILLNTDLHNHNIRSDRKMTVEAFVLNNTNYGRDIMEEGKELPRVYLENIYKSIREEEIRTECEGAEGVMTVERWKDVLKSSHVLKNESKFLPLPTTNPTGVLHKAEAHDVKNLVFEMCIFPILSAISTFWEEVDSKGRSSNKINDGSGSGMLGAECARLGMDLAIELLAGSRLLVRKDLFAKVFSEVCYHSGLLKYDSDNYERALLFIHSVQKQSALIVAMNCSREFAEFLGQSEWKLLWLMIFELRDLKLLGVQGGGLLVESEVDLLTKYSRMELNMHFIKDAAGDNTLYNGGVDYRTGLGSLFGSMGKMLFGEEQKEQQNQASRLCSIHKKEDLIIWNEMSPSDEEDEVSAGESVGGSIYENDGELGASFSSPGAIFESQLVHEDHLVFVETTHQSMPLSFLSPRGRVRRRLASMCDFYGLVADSRFLSQEGIQFSLSAILDVLEASDKKNFMKASVSTSVSEDGVKEDTFLSPASEALAEVLVCEIALKNRDRIRLLWDSLNTHYRKRLALSHPCCSPNTDSGVLTNPEMLMRPGIEKCASGLIRLCACMVQRSHELINDILPSLQHLYRSPLITSSNVLDKHLGEGLWRICRNVDGLKLLNQESWESVLGLADYCACKGGEVILCGPGRGGLSEDDPALNTYRSIHLISNAHDLKYLVPFSVVRCVRSLILSGERGNCSKLSVAGLDILFSLHNLFKRRSDDAATVAEADSDWWISVIEGIAEAGKTSKFGSVRMHALAMLTDVVTDKHGSSIAPWQLYSIVQNTCVSVAAFRIKTLLKYEDVEEVEDVLIELKLCISLVFKPLLHHLKALVQVEEKFPILWQTILQVMDLLLCEEANCTPGKGHGRKSASQDSLTKENLLMTTKELGCEHLRNAVMVLMSYGVIEDDAALSKTRDLSALTWETISSMPYCSESVDEWKQSGKLSYHVENKASDSYAGKSEQDASDCLSSDIAQPDR